MNKRESPTRLFHSLCLCVLLTCSLCCRELRLVVAVCVRRSKRVCVLERCRVSRVDGAVTCERRGEAAAQQLQQQTEQQQQQRRISSSHTPRSHTNPPATQVRERTTRCGATAGRGGTGARHAGRTKQAALFALRSALYVRAPLLSARLHVASSDRAGHARVRRSRAGLLLIASSLAGSSTAAPALCLLLCLCHIFSAHSSSVPRADVCLCFLPRSSKCLLLGCSCCRLLRHCRHVARSPPRSEAVRGGRVARHRGTGTRLPAGTAALERRGQARRGKAVAKRDQRSQSGHL